MKQAFFSYAREDSRKAKRLYGDLRRKALISPWFDRDLFPGERWRPAIRRAIRDSDYFLAILSETAASNRGYIHKELRQALDVAEEFPEGWIYLIPTRLDDCQMPFLALEAFNCIDLFPRWEDGVNQLCRTLKYHTEGRKQTPEGDTLDLQDLGERDKNPAKVKHRGPRRRRKFQAPRLSERSLHYDVKLINLEGRIPRINRIARGLNSVQSCFSFTHERMPLPHQALGWEDDTLQLFAARLPMSFYERIGLLETDCVISLTRRLLAGEGYWNYLADVSPVPQVFFISCYSDLDYYAREAGVTLDSAIAFMITAQLVAYFFDLGYDLPSGYHAATRNCPMDFTEDHSELVPGLRAGRFCRFCSPKIDKSGPFGKAFRAMIAWDR